MTSGAPWSVKGIDPKAREIAKDLARRSGMKSMVVDGYDNLRAWRYFRDMLGAH